MTGDLLMDSSTNVGMLQESYVTILTTLTVFAGMAWRAGAPIRLMQKIFFTCSSVYAVGISVAPEFCNISVFQYYSISISVIYSLLC